jgi:hypothetical protein
MLLKSLMQYGVLSMKRILLALSAAGLLFSAAPAFAALTTTPAQVFNKCPDDPKAQACPPTAELFVASHTPGAKTDELIVKMVLRIAEAVQDPKIKKPVCLNAADGLRVLSKGMTDLARGKQINDIADALCDKILTAAITASVPANGRNGNGDSSGIFGKSSGGTSGGSSAGGGGGSGGGGTGGTGSTTSDDPKGNNGDNGHHGDGNSGKSDTKGNNGVGNGVDPLPPGNPPENDGVGTSPGDPGQKRVQSLTVTTESVGEPKTPPTENTVVAATENAVVKEEKTEAKEEAKEEKAEAKEEKKADQPTGTPVTQSQPSEAAGPDTTTPTAPPTTTSAAADDKDKGKGKGH